MVDLYCINCSVAALWRSVSMSVSGETVLLMLKDSPFSMTWGGTWSSEALKIVLLLVGGMIWHPFSHFLLPVKYSLVFSWKCWFDHVAAMKSPDTHWSCLKCCTLMMHTMADRLIYEPSHMTKACRWQTVAATKFEVNSLWNWWPCNFWIKGWCSKGAVVYGCAKLFEEMEMRGNSIYFFLAWLHRRHQSKISRQIEMNK